MLHPSGRVILIFVGFEQKGMFMRLTMIRHPRQQSGSVRELLHYAKDSDHRGN